ncbi:MAG: diacylglycerol kinase [Bythopirellula sp.]
MHATRPPESESLVIRWRRKFACALRGLSVGVRGNNSFYVHLVAAGIVVAVAAWLNVSSVEWWVLLLCISMVLTAELFNSSIELIARSITTDEHPQIRDALDVASSAVLVASVGAAVVGLRVLFF